MDQRQEKRLILAKELAIEKGGQCLSDKYIDNRSDLKWQCNNSHTWLAPLRNINEREGWCPKCREYESKKIGTAKVKNKLNEKGWKLIKGKAEGYKKRSLTVECEKEHQWKTSPQSIFYNGCPECSNRSNNKQKHMEEIRQFVSQRGGKILSGKYQTLESKFNIECVTGHQWITKGTYLKNEKWCPVCAGRDKKEQLKQLHEIAIDRGGLCLANGYIHKEYKLKFKCSDGHSFYMTPHNVKAGQWCPYCSWHKEEHKARYVFEGLLDIDLNRNGRVIDQFVLDGYTELPNGRKLAFEYNGRQHYEYVEFFHRNYQEFVKRQLDDKKKKTLCRERNIELIVIPYYNVKTDEDLLHYIQNELKLLELFTQPVIDTEVFFSGFYKATPIRKKLEKIIKSKNGVLLTKHYIGIDGLVTVECERGHNWTTRAQNILTNRWCPECGGVLRDKERLYEKLKSKIDTQGGQLIDQTYKASDSKVTVICAKGHEFKMTANNITSNNQWCPKCKKVSRDKVWLYSQLKKYVEKKGGELLTSEYTLSRHKVKVKCHQGHIFEKTVNNITSKNQWCAECKTINKN